MSEETKKPARERVHGRVRTILNNGEWVFELRHSGITFRRYRGRKAKKMTFKELMEAAEGQFLMNVNQ